MNKKNTKLLHGMCNWSGLGFTLFILAGMMLAGFIPPPSPALNSGEVSGIYANNLIGVRVGGVMIMLGAALFIPFTALIARYIIRIEGGVGVVTMMQVMAGLTNMILFFYPALWWLTASFRPERGAELTQVLHDAAWIQFVGALFPFLFQLVSVAIATFLDDSSKPVFPRWFGFLNLWTIVLYFPGQMIFFFKSGPFAWNGLFAYWIPGSTFFAWVLLMFIVLRKAINAEEQGE